MRLRELFGPSHVTEDRRAHGGAIVTAIAGAAFAATTAGVVAATVINLALSLALSFVLGKLAGGRPKQPDVKRELAQPKSRPAYRYVYGHANAFGSPWPWVQTDGGDYLWGVLLFNSRPSEGNFTVYADKRELEYTGDPYDFSASGGATLTGPGIIDGDLKFWIGRGDQTQPPQKFLDEASSHFQASDQYAGLTVLFIWLERGKDEDLMEKWPAWPPEFEMVGDWSLVWDPNDPAQSLDDPSTWTFSENRTRCVLDALTQNPLRPYREANLHLDSFKASATVDDEDVTLKGGGTEKRHRVSGVLVWDEREVHEQVEPLVTAGGSPEDLIRIGGKLGLVSGEIPESAATITDVLDDDLEWRTLKPGRDLASRVTTSYVEPDADWQLAELPTYEVPGAVAEDGGVPAVEHLDLDFVPSHAQAARLQKRHAYRLRAQKRITATLPPAAFDLVAGSAVTLDLPSPWSAMNGLYQVQRITPRLIEAGDDGLVLRCPAELVEVKADGYDWDPATEEPDVPEGVAVDPVPSGLPVPTFTAASDDTTSLSAGTFLYARIAVTPTDPGTPVNILDVRYREQGTTDWLRTRSVHDFDAATATQYITPVSPGTTYEIQARWLKTGKASDWGAGGVAGDSVLVLAESPSSTTPSAPSADSATGGAGQISVTFGIGNDDQFHAIEFYASSTNDSGTASLIHGPVYGSPTQTYGHTETGLGASETRYYWARAVDGYGGRSAFSPVLGATTDP